MKKKNILILTILVFLGLQGFGQNASLSVVGYVVDKWQNPIYGAQIVSVDNPNFKTTTDKTGKFQIDVTKTGKFRIVTPDNSYKIVDIGDNESLKIIMGFSSQAVNIGYSTTQNIEESTASVAIAYNQEFNKRSARDIGSSLFGNVLGLTALQGSGEYYDYNNIFYVRGLQTLQSSGNTPLILVDGIERDLTFISPEEVESVTVLKDAVATALYGYKGANGAINVVTKRGKYKSREIKFSYDHAINTQLRRPKFANSATYAKAMNEALANDGLSPRYNPQEVDAFESGRYPFLYPNIDWIKETFKDAGSTSIYNLSFRGGGNKFRYYTLLNLQNNSGFISKPNENQGYSTQNQHSKANLRSNLDIDLTPNTTLVLNLLGTIAEMRRPGQSVDLWDLIYSLPSAAFPIKTEEGLWGGNVTWNGNVNPVAQSQASGYSKYHKRSLFADMTLKQDLSLLLPGLAGGFRMAYDNSAVYWEDHYKTFAYGSSSVTEWIDGHPNLDKLSQYKGGAETGLATGSDLQSWNRAFNIDANINYGNTFDNHKIYSQLKWNYEYLNINGINNTWYQLNLSSYSHYGYKERYFADLSLVVSAANKLAPSNRWGFSPTLSTAWIVSKEEFLRSNAFIDFLKLRASFGIINRDNIPAESYWEQIYQGGNLYFFNTGYASDLGSWKLGRLATSNPTHEKALKSNIGLDATFFKGLNITLDGYYQKRKDIWVESSGKYSSALGFDPPFENGGIVDSYGLEVGLEYLGKINDFSYTLGGNFTYGKNKIKEQYEELRLYDNLVRTRKPVSQLFGLIADGFFKDIEDIQKSPIHTFTNVKPGDIKYKDINKDGVIDNNDLTAIGYNTVVPEIYYSFKLGAAWKGIGFNMNFQGTGNYSAMLNTKSVYWPLINNTSISEHYYNNRWTPENKQAKYPRLSSESNNNNFQNNTLWLADRSFLKLRYVELYYDFPKSILQRTSFMDNVKIYLRGVDLLSFDKIKIADPESYGATNPLTSSLVVGLTLGF